MGRREIRQEDSYDIPSDHVRETFVRLLNYYHISAAEARRNGNIAAIVTITMTAITPILVLSDLVSPILQAIPAGLAGISAALSAHYKWNENYVRATAARERLEHEYAAYEGRALQPYDNSLDERVRLSNFVRRTQGIARQDVAAWIEIQGTEVEDTRVKTPKE